MKSKRILIVEDDIIAQMTLTQMLEDMGYEHITTSSTLEETKSVLASETIDLALLDVFLHGDREGLRVAKYIRESQTPFIFLTASHDSETYQLMNELDHSGILEKPYDYTDINEAVSNFLATKSDKRTTNSRTEPLNTPELNAVFDAVAIGVCVVDDEQQILRLNDAMAHILESSTDDLKGAKLCKLIPDIEKEPWGNGVTVEHQITTKNGRIVDVSITNADFQSADTNYNVITITDISDQKKNLKKLEEQSTKNKELIGEIHHRVKNSLNTVSGLLYLNEQDYLEENAGRDLRRLRQRVRMLAKVHNLFFKDDFLKNILSTDFMFHIASELNEIFAGVVRIEAQKATKFEIDNDLAIRLGLAIHELILAAIAGSQHDLDVATITISLIQENERLLLTMTQNGGSLDQELKKENLGYKIVKSICGEENITYTDEDHPSITIALKSNR